MVSSQHEAMHYLFRIRPDVFARATRELGLPFDDPLQVELLSTNLTEINPLERHVDTPLRITTREGTYILLVEAQRRKAADKISAWAYYSTYMHAKYGLPVVLMVVCEDEETAAWASGPFEIGVPQWTTIIVRPLVLGPQSVPVITDPDIATQDVPLAVLSAITHTKDQAIGDILKALAPALRTLDEDDRQILAELTELGLGNTRAAQTWRQLMAVDLSFFRSETSQRIRAEGEAKGEAKSILRILDSRNIAIPDEVRHRIATCTDHDQLNQWLDRVVHIETIDDLFT